MSSDFSSNTDELLNFANDLQQEYEDKLPPVHLWSPDLSGDINIRIDREGRWFHEGGPMKRQSMIEMFSSILKREDDEYFLVTPVEKWRIQVDVAPFVILSMRVELSGDIPNIFFTSNVGQEVLLSKDHKLWLEVDENDGPIPLMDMRNNMPALINRNVFYELVSLAKSEEVEGVEKVWIESSGERFYLGEA